MALQRTFQDLLNDDARKIITSGAMQGHKFDPSGAILPEVLWSSWNIDSDGMHRIQIRVRIDILLREQLFPLACEDQ